MHSINDLIEGALDNIHEIDPDYMSSITINPVSENVLNDHTYKTFAVTLIHDFNDDSVNTLELYVCTIDTTDANDMSVTSCERWHMSHHENGRKA